jgi:hypothetical protein
MNVVSLRPREPLPMHWQGAEINAMLAACADALDKGLATSWHVGSTEAGDPQLYLLGPAPDYDCILSITRLGRLYVVEDGRGQILFEHDAMSHLAEQVRSTLRRHRTAIAAKVMIAWAALREAFEERIEPAFAEPMEMLSHLAPQLAALA